MDDAIIRGRAEHGEEGADAPVGRGRPLVLVPISKPILEADHSYCEYRLKPGAQGAVLGGRRAGWGQANMALQGPVCWPNVAKSGRPCQHSDVTMLN